MPLRDHFRPPVWKKASWEGFHGLWPGMIVLRLDKVLPEDYSAEPRVHFCKYYEIDVCAYEEDEPRPPTIRSAPDSGSGATATLAPPQPTHVIDVDLDEQYEYEVKVYDQSRGRVLVAAVDIVSPANKDRALNRRAFATKCAALIQQDVCVSIVDLVTTRRFNLYAEMLDLMGQSEPSSASNPPNVYAVTCRGRKLDQRCRLESWAYPLSVGQALPSLPLWLSEELFVWLDLEASYEETCRVLRIA